MMGATAESACARAPKHAIINKLTIRFMVRSEARTSGREAQL
jgi:hypothetical protein